MVESWKVDGNCNNCRRQNYCGKPCTIHKRQKQYLIQNAVRKVLSDKLRMDKIEEVLKGGVSDGC